MSKIVCLSPSNQTENKYAYGGTNEAAQCQRIADKCKIALERCGIKVLMASNAKTMAQKCQISDDGKANLHVPIHTNAGGKGYGGTRCFCAVVDASTSGYKAASAICKRLAPITPGTIAEAVTAYPTLYEIKTPKAPTAYIEVDFHDVAAYAKWIIENVELIGETIAHGICDYFGISYIAPGSDIDIGKGHDYSADSRRKAIQKGIIKGNGTNADGSIDYDWMDGVTREELVTILDRMGLL